MINIFHYSSGNIAPAHHVPPSVPSAKDNWTQQIPTSSATSSGVAQSQVQHAFGHQQQISTGLSTELQQTHLIAQQLQQGNLAAASTPIPMPGQPVSGQLQTVSLSNIPPKDLQKIRADAERAILRQISDEQKRNLQAEVQAVILKQLTPEQIKQINIDAEAAIWEKLQNQKLQDILAQQQIQSQPQSVQSQVIA